MIERLRDPPGWNGLALCGALLLPIIAILLFTPHFGVLAIPEVLVCAGMAGWLCYEQRASVSSPLIALPFTVASSVRNATAEYPIMKGE